MGLTVSELQCIMAGRAQRVGGGAAPRDVWELLSLHTGKQRGRDGTGEQVQASESCFVNLTSVRLSLLKSPQLSKRKPKRAIAVSRFCLWFLWSLSGLLVCPDLPSQLSPCILLDKTL